MHLSPGDCLGPYEILALIGAGGMGEVYKARDTRLDRFVAVKFADARFSDRFQREAQAIAALSHPNICHLYDVGPNYLVMELIEGRPIRPTDSVRKLLDIAVQIADALATAHAAGIVHRDLKPENILITPEGRIKVLDFGIAKSAGIAFATGETAHTVTVTGTTVGTVAYMSPEQARGDPNLSSQSDQFSFGLILYELITGERPFRRGSNPETMAAIIRDDAPALPATAPLALRWMVERLLAKEPAERYESSRDLYRELRHIRERLSEATISGQSAAVPAVRHRLPFRTAGILLLCILAGGLSATLFGPSAKTDIARYQFTPLSREEATERSPDWSPDGKRIAYTASIHGILQVFTKAVGAPDSAQLTRSTESCSSPFWSRDGGTIYYTTPAGLWAVAASGGSPQLLVERASLAAIHPDGKTVAFFREHKLWISPLHGGQPHEFGQAPFPANPDLIWAKFSNDGAKLAVVDSSVRGTGGDIWILSFPSGAARKIGTGRNEASWFPDSRHLAVVEGDLFADRNTLSILDVQGQNRSVAYVTPDLLLNPSVSPDGRRIAYVKGVLEWDVVEVSLPSSAIRTLRGGGGTSWMPAWAPSGNHYLFVTNRSGAYAIEDMSADGGFARRLVEIRPGDFVKSPSWAPDGTRFIFDLLSSGGQTLMLANAASGTATAFDTDAKQSCCGVWAPDGEWVVYLRSTGGVWEMAKAKPGVSSSRTVFPSGATPESAIEWSPAGDWILCAARDGLTLVSRDGHSVRKLSSRNFDGGFAGPVAGFSKDGKQVFGVFHNTSGAGAEWQLFSVDVSTGAEKLLGALNVPAYAGSMVGFSLHPDGDRFATSISKWPYDIWMVEGIQEPKSWLGRLIQN